MITSMRHPHSEATLDVPVPGRQESRSWTCPFPRDTIEDYNKDQLRNTDARIEAVEKSLSELLERGGRRRLKFDRKCSQKS